jgi:hypothetical protein
MHCKLVPESVSFRRSQTCSYENPAFQAVCRNGIDFTPTGVMRQFEMHSDIEEIKRTGIEII